jgi:hypothetical protein
MRICALATWWLQLDYVAAMGVATMKSSDLGQPAQRVASSAGPSVSGAMSTGVYGSDPCAVPRCPCLSHRSIGNPMGAPHRHIPISRCGAQDGHAGFSVMAAVRPSCGRVSRCYQCPCEVARIEYVACETGGVGVILGRRSSAMNVIFYHSSCSRHYLSAFPHSHYHHYPQGHSAAPIEGQKVMLRRPSRVSPKSC